MVNWLPRWLAPRPALRIDRARKLSPGKARRIRVECLEDRPVPAATLSINDVSMTEGNGSHKDFVFTVTLSEPSDQTVTVEYSTAEGTALDNIDYKREPTGIGEPKPFLTFLAGETEKTFAIRIKGDIIQESDETFFVNLSNAVNATIQDGQALATIINDDGNPVANPDAYSVNEDSTLTVNASGVLANDTDPDADPLTAVLVSGPSHGALTLNANGSFTYTPDANFNGADSFTYSANDGWSNSPVATVSITVNAVNDAPVAVDGAVQMAEDAQAGGQVSASDVDGDSLTYSLVNGPAHGSVVLNSDGSFNYNTAANYRGGDSFTYLANDGSVDSNVATVSITITPVNDAPVAASGSAESAEDSQLGGQVSASDVDGGSLTYILVNGPAHGSLVLNSDGSFTYNPDSDYNGADSFTFKANDGTTDSNVATISITITPVNDAPVATDGSLETTEDSSAGGQVVASDLDGDTLTYSVVSGPTHGTLVLNADGAFTYTPVAEFNGTDSFTYKANDGTADSNVATVAITVTAVNDAPVAADGSVETAEDTQTGGQANASDVDGDILTYSLVDGPAHGTLVLNADGSFSYSPDSNYNGTDSFTYKANDGSVDSNVATVSITVTPVNDAPVVANGSAETAEDTQSSGQVGATDVDGDALTFSVVGGPAHGTLVLNADGSFTFTPDSNYNGTDSFTYKANDGTADSNVAVVTITVNAVNDAPVAANGSAETTEDSSVGGQVSASDVDGDSLTYSMVSGPAHGTLEFNADGSFTYTPNSDYNGSDSFTYKANDGSVDSNTATVAITVAPANDAPVAADGSLETAEDSSASGQVGASDLDGDTLTYSVVTGPAHGTLVLNSDGSFSYSPDLDFNGADSFTFKANDGTADSNTATVTITVTTVNDAPVAADNSVETAEDAPLGGQVAASDVDSNSLTFSLVEGP